MAIHAFGDDHSALAHEALLHIQAYIGERTIAQSVLTKIVLSSIAQGDVGLATVVDRALARLDSDGYL